MNGYKILEEYNNSLYGKWISSQGLSTIIMVDSIIPMIELIYAYWTKQGLMLNSMKAWSFKHSNFIAFHVYA